MNGVFKLGIKHKLFLIILLVLMLNLVVLLFAGSAFFEGFYHANKLNEISRGAQRLKDAYSQGEQAFSSALNELENRNILITIFAYEPEAGFSYEYYTRRRMPNEREKSAEAPPSPQRDYPIIKSGGQEQFHPESRLPSPEVLQSIAQSGKDYMIEDNPSKDLSFLRLFSHVKGNTYILVETPRRYISEIADLALQYTAYLSAASLLLGAIVIYIVVSRITKPIQQIQSTAEQIAHLDFSGTCQASSTDEIGLLAQSINHMSEELQSNINALMKANLMLRDDILRQEQTDRMRRQFIANVSHDFKTPLTLITSYAEALRDFGKEDEEASQEYCRIILDEGEKMSAMLRQLLGLTQLESGMIQLERTVFSISEIMQDVAQKYKLLTRQRSISVSLALDDSIIVDADYQQIGEVVTNLFENAVKYAQEGAQIRVSALRQGSQCRIAVFNTGSPIAEQDLPNLFLSFYRGDKSRHRDQQGYGLGLAIVRSILEMHGEHYGVQNTEGGVEFWFTLPITELENPPTEL